MPKDNERVNEKENTNKIQEKTAVRKTGSDALEK